MSYLILCRTDGMIISSKVKTKEKAEKEAEEMACNNIGEIYDIYELVSYVQCKPTIHKVKLTQEEIHGDAPYG